MADEKWVYPLPDALDPARAAPLMCAGVTSWEALRHWDVGAGSTVGVVGVGGLGHIAVKLAAALGAEVVAFTPFPDQETTIKELGADEVILAGDERTLAAQGRRFDFIVDTASAPHDPAPYLRALKLHGTLCVLGIVDTIAVESRSLRVGRHNLSGSGTGSPATTMQMLDFCAEHQILADVDVLPARQVSIAMDRLVRGDVKFRMVLDMADLSAQS